MGHVLKERPSIHAFIASPAANGYISASDEEDSLALATHLVADSSVKQEEDTIDSDAAVAGFPSLLVQRVLAAQLVDEEDMSHREISNFRM
jgi:hypothetical protein